VWLGGELFLLRQVSHAATASAVQGVWLDYRVLSERLLGEITDLLPLAKLVPAEGARAAEDPLTLVSFPFRLVRNEAPAPAPAAVEEPFGAPLLVAWTAVGLAILTSILLVSGIMRLSERRASFVSAVTHELRTPLTTFRLYSDMLEGGVVREEKRADYLRILSREADRLSHLVENVLAFSRIERGSARANIRETTAGDLLERMRDRFESRLATAGLSLAMELPPAVAARRIRIDTAAVEHILFNLIDNSAKYAAGSEPPVVHVDLADAGSSLEITVRDHGPGIPGGELRRIFRPFHKSACDAAESKPGVGLGLALSLRLARSVGGTLDCVQGQGGACFLLRLPAF
jgi:signal transduction histidine kinase